MQLRVISGIIVTNTRSKKSGSATIDFNAHAVSGDGAGFNLTSIGPNKAFKKRPCFTVSLRNIRHTDDDRDHQAFGGGLYHEWQEWDIRTQLDQTGRNSMVVRWNASSDGVINEISYMIIGECE